MNNVNVFTSAQPPGTKKYCIKFLRVDFTRRSRNIIGTFTPNSVHFKIVDVSCEKVCFPTNSENVFERFDRFCNGITGSSGNLSNNDDYL